MTQRRRRKARQPRPRPGPEWVRRGRYWVRSPLAAARAARDLERAFGDWPGRDIRINF